MPRKPSNTKLNLSVLTEKQVWRLINDAASGRATGSTNDWRTVAFYFRNRSIQAREKLQEVESFVSDLRLARRICSEALDRIATWSQPK